MTYDAHQMGAVLTMCTQCGREYYMTKPDSTCIACRRGVSTGAEMSESEYPVVECPKCQNRMTDFDGFGFLFCTRCSFCVHPSITGGVCGLCEREVPAWEQEPGA